MRLTPVLASAFLCLGAATAALTRDAGLQAMLVRTTAWLERLEAEFAVVIGDETYHQQVGTERYPVAPRENFRDLRSETAFVWVPEDGMWTFARNVRTVDGEPVDGSSQRMTGILQEAADRLARLRGLRGESAKFNIGPVYRNFNDPMFALQFLDARWQGHFNWKRRGRERVGGVNAARVDFTEPAPPFMVHGNGDDIPSSGTVWIEEATGIVYRTSLDVLDAPAGIQGLTRVRGRIRTDFAKDARLQIVVPVRMTEEYNMMQGGQGFPLRVVQTIFGDATYSNFRRFETSGRLMEPSN